MRSLFSLILWNLRSMCVHIIYIDILCVSMYASTKKCLPIRISYYIYIYVGCVFEYKTFDRKDTHLSIANEMVKNCYKHKSNGKRNSKPNKGIYLSNIRLNWFIRILKFSFSYVNMGNGTPMHVSRTFIAFALCIVIEIGWTKVKKCRETLRCGDDGSGSWLLSTKRFAT